VQNGGISMAGAPGFGFDQLVDFADTPQPPYTAVIFTSVRTEGDNGYGAMAEAMNELAAQQPGYLGMEAARDGLGITVAYFRDEASARAWKNVADHREAQRLGREKWYAGYRLRIATVTRDYGWDR
jgi:heme-degrading monooxygenase HmoA